MDVEGYEPLVLASMANLIGSHGVENIVLEYSPGAADACSTAHAACHHFHACITSQVRRSS